MSDKRPVLMPAVPPEELIVAAFRARYPEDQRNPTDREREWFRTSYAAIYELLAKPRKVKVTRWAVFDGLGGYVCTTGTKVNAESYTSDNGGLNPPYRIVELHGEYEEPWS